MAHTTSGHAPVSGRGLALVWIGLLVLTAVSFGVSHIHFGVGDAIVALAIACLKTALVMLFFMGLWEARFTWRMVMIVTVVIIVTLVGLVSSDPLTRRTYPVADEPPLDSADEEVSPPPVAGQPVHQP